MKHCKAGEMCLLSWATARHIYTVPPFYQKKGTDKEGEEANAGSGSRNGR